MIPKFLLLFTIISLSFSAQENRQNTINIFPPSAEAGKLVKKLEYKLNGSTGLTALQIPLHEVKLKNFNLPITLDYHYTGLKVTEISSNVGIGWSLNVGGKVTQIVFGMNDLEARGYAHNGITLPNNRAINPQAYNIGSNVVGNDDYYLLRWVTGDEVYDGSPNYSTDLFDTEPDMFYYSYPGKSSKFFLANMEAYQIPAGKENIKFNNGPVTIVDTMGNRYIYGERETAETIHMDSSPIPFVIGNASSLAYTFHLTEIITVNNDHIYFDYQQEDYSYIADIQYTRYKPNDLQGYFATYGSLHFVKTTTSTSFIKGKRLAKIRVNNSSEVNFIYEDFRRRDVYSVTDKFPASLKKIEIYSASTLIDAIEFSTSYVGNTQNLTLEGTAQNRLILDAVKTKTLHNPHIFEYYPGGPGRLSELKDDYGYYSTNGSRFKKSAFDYNSTDRDRSPTLPETRQLSLKKLTYPTKGFDMFDYELNSYYTANFTKDSLIEAPAVHLYATESRGHSTMMERTFEIPPSISESIIRYCVGDNRNQTTEYYTNISLYKDNEQIPLVFIPSTSPQTIEKKLTPGTYRITLETKGVDCAFVEVRWREKFTINEGPKNVLTSGLRNRSIKTYSADNEIAYIKEYIYEKDGNSTGTRYVEPEFINEFTISSPLISEDCFILQNHALYRTQSSQSVNNIFGYGPSPVYYSEVQELTLDKDSNIKDKIVKEYSQQEDLIVPGLYNDTHNISFDWLRGNLVKTTSYYYTDNVPSIQQVNTYNYKPLSLLLDDPYQNFYNVNFHPNEYHRMTLKVKEDLREINYMCPRSHRLWIPVKRAASFNYSVSKVISAWNYLESQTREDYLNDDVLKTSTEYFYANPGHIQATSKTVTFPDLSREQTTYLYAHEKANQKLIDANMVGIPLETEVKKDGRVISKTETKYEDLTHLFPTSLKAYNTDKKDLSEELIYDHYDSNGNLLQYTTKAGVPTAIVWGYSKTQPIAKIEGATYNQVSALASGIIAASDADALQAPGNDETTLLELLDAFRKNLPAHQVTTYTYDPLIGVRSITPPSGLREVYEYDSAGRLESVKDRDGRDLKKYEYHYKTP